MAYFLLESEYFKIHINNGFIQNPEDKTWHNVRYIRKFYVSNGSWEDWRDKHKIYAVTDQNKEILIGLVSQHYCPHSTLNRIIEYFNLSLDSVQKHFDDSNNPKTSIPTTSPEKPCFVMDVLADPNNPP